MNPMLPRSLPLLVLLLVLLPVSAAPAQQGRAEPGRVEASAPPARRAPLVGLPDPGALAPVVAGTLRPPAALGRHLLVGGGAGAVVGGAFGLAVVSLADCGGPGCAKERVVGVVGHALAGAVVGALAGGIVYLLRR